MKLSQQQLDTYDRDGYIVLPDLLSNEEISILRDELDRLSGIECSFTRREKTGKIQTMYRMHEDNGPTQSPAFRALCRLPRTLGIAQQIMGDDSTYIFHTKINMKPAIEGVGWSWHQDYGQWKFDGLPSPIITTCLVLLDDADEMGGPLYIAPGSHKLGNLLAVEDPGVVAANRYSLPRDELIATLRARKPVSITGKRGLVAFFHSNLVHGSGQNISPNDRRQLYIVYNPVANRPDEGARIREEHLSSKNHAPIPMVEDDAILRTVSADALTPS